MNEFYNEKIVIVLREENEEVLENIIRTCLEANIKAIELTYSIPNVCSILENLNVKYPNVFLGVGSVINSKQCEDAISSGAKFIVSPGSVLEVQEICDKYNIMYIPGVMTVSEIIKASSRNEIIKLFPGDTLGCDYIKAIKAPLPNLNIMVTGGVNVDNIDDWFEAGVKMVGLGGFVANTYKNEGEESLINLLKELKCKVEKW